MRKTIALLVVALAAALLFAGDFSFHLVNTVPLYREPYADPYSFNTNVNVTIVPKSEDNEFRFRSFIRDNTTGKFFLDDLAYGEKPKDSDNMYINMKVAGDANLFRFRYDGSRFVPAMDAELTFAGYINTFFCLYGGANTLDFDGSYLLAGSVRVADMVTLRAGMHHFSGHYGDETLSKALAYNGINFGDNGNFNYTGDKAEAGHTYSFISTLEYVRDNSWLFSLSADVTGALRVYGECEVPMDGSWLRPWIHTPAGFTHPVHPESEEDGTFKLADGEGLPKDLYEDQIQHEIDLKTGSGYRALRVHGGVEYRFDLSFGGLVLAADIQAHQDGMTKHDIDSFDPKNPWEFELTAGAVLELGKVFSNDKVVRVQAYLHEGRAPGTQLFYKRGTFIYVGFGVNC